MTIRLEHFEIELPNGSDGDSLVHARLPLAGESIVFDAGDCARLALRDLLRVTDVLVSHCHVDHFIGFDAIIRPRVCRPETVRAHGGPGFLDHVQSRLAGYTWNLVEGNHFVVEARELRHDRVHRARFDSGKAFVREDLPDEPRDSKLCFDDGRLRVEAEALDHHIVTTGWAVELPRRITADVEAVRARGLFPGAWLGDLKKRVELDAEPLEAFLLPDGTTAPIGALTAELLSVRPGERVAYVTDTICDASTRPRIVALAAASDVFACGAPFLDAEAERAVATRHLTARQAGEMAAEAGAARLLLFHVSERYGADFRRHQDEANDGAKGRVEIVMEHAGED